MSAGKRELVARAIGGSASGCVTAPSHEPGSVAFVACSLPELLRLTPADFDELDEIAGDPEDERAWWQRRRQKWNLDDQEGPHEQA